VQTSVFGHESMSEAVCLLLVFENNKSRKGKGERMSIKESTKGLILAKTTI
jgi:hypothetical protein